MATNPDQSGGLAAMRGAQTVVPIAWDAGTSGAFSGLSVLSLADEKLPLGRGHLSDEVFEELAFLDPFGYLLTELRRNVQSTRPPTLFPG